MATAIPTIVASLQGSQFAWIGSAYTLAAVATIPSSGNLANLFGRRSVLLGYLLIFALGSALCGAAQSMAMLIGGRSKL
jgi:MFS family permease